MAFKVSDNQLVFLRSVPP